MKRLLSIVLSACMLVTFMPAMAFADSSGSAADAQKQEENCPSRGFKDLDTSQWYHEAADYVITNKIMKGMTPDTFEPDTELSRAMIVQMIWNLEGQPSGARDAGFKDVASGSWYEPAVSWAASNGIVGGYSKEAFGPDDSITREQTAAILNRYAAFKKYDVTAGGTLDSFTDAAQVSDWALDSMKWAVGAGLINGMGDGTVQPQGTATRAQVAQMFLKFDKAFGKKADGKETDPSGNKNTTPKIDEGNNGSGSDPVRFPVASYTIKFDSNGGSAVKDQRVFYGDTVTEPSDPFREGYTFAGWTDESGSVYEFDECVDKSFTLKAEWAKVAEVSDLTEEQKAFALDKEISGEEQTELSDPESESSIITAKVNYDLDNMGTVVITKDESGQLSGTAGLQGDFVEINAVGAGVKEATVSFSYNPEKLGDNDPEDLAIVWYDEKNNVVKLLDNSTVNTETHTVSAKTDHFSRYGVVLRSLWNKAWNAKLPAVRTESRPFYDIIIDVDSSGSMSGSKIRQSVEAAQNLLDALADEDLVAVDSFAGSTKEVVSKTPLVEEKNGVKTDNRKRIKDQIATIDAYGGTNIQGALDKAASNDSAESKFQSFIILISDGQSSVSDDTLQKLKENGQKVITVGIGSDVDESLMKRVADQTNGSYLFCDDASDLKQAFSDIQHEYIASTTDSDGDGLSDEAEIEGMRDQKGQIFKTDPNKADTDGDGYSDSEEMGEYKANASNSYFIRKSNPNKYTIKEKNMYFTDKFSMNTSVDAAHKFITVDLLFYPCTFKEELDKEYLYADPININVSLSKYPGKYQLKGPVTIDLNSNRATAVLSYKEMKEDDSVTWKISAENCLNESGQNYIKTEQKLYNIEANKSVRSGASSDFEIKLAKQGYKIMQAISKGTDTRYSEEKSEKTGDYFERVKEQIKPAIPTEKEIPDQVYEAMGTAIYQTLDQSVIEQYETNPNKLAKQIAKQIAGGLVNFQSTKIVVDGYTCVLNGNMWANSGISAAIINVGWQGPKKKDKGDSDFTFTNAETPDGKDALSKYCAALAQLNNDVWKEFLAYYVTDFTGLVGIKGITKENARYVLDFSETTIKAINNKDDANEMIKTLGPQTQNQLKSVFKNNFKKFIKKNIPNGEKIINSAEKYQEVKDKYNEYKEALNGSDKDEILNSYCEMEALYNSLVSYTDALE